MCECIPAGPRARQIDVGDPAIVRQLAERNGVETVEDDGWLSVGLRGFTYRARLHGPVEPPVRSPFGPVLAGLVRPGARQGAGS